MKTIRKTRIVIAMLIMTLLICITPVSKVRARGLDSEDVRKGVVKILIYAPGGGYLAAVEPFTQSLVKIKSCEGGISFGSGFFVGNDKENPQYLVTNNHVVDAFLECNEGNGYTYVYDDDALGSIYYVGKLEIRVLFSDKEGDYEKAYVVDHGDTEKVDLAVLRLQNPTDKRHALPIGEVTQDMVGDTVYTVGFPGVAENGLTGGSSSGENDVTITKGAIGRLVTNDEGVKRINIDATIAHGNSGGPLVTEDGVVIGVNTNGISAQGEETYYAIDSCHVIDLLNKNNIPYEKANTGINVILIIGIVVGVCVVAALVVVIIIMVKKKKKTGSNENISNNNGNIASQSGGGIPMVRSLSVQHNGATYSLSGGSIMIGRDPSSCKIVYREGTSGVSGRHCTIAWDVNTREFVVTDLKSTYGTYLMNGQKLQPNVPYRLRAGEKICIGDKANVISVEVN